MPLKSAILSGSSRLEQVLAGGASVKPAPPADDVDAVSRIQRGLTALGFSLPQSFAAGGPDGKYGPETTNAVITFQKSAFPGLPGEWDGRVGKKTLEKLDAALPLGAAPAPPPPAAKPFMCGPDVTDKVKETWTKVQTDFAGLTFFQKIQSCNTILIPFQRSKDPFKIPTDIEELKRLIRQHADINGWDTLPLFQGESRWLREPPVFDAALNGPCATPSSSNPSGGAFDPAHEDPATCSNTVQIGGKCWLNGSVNYGMFGVMVRLCSDFARTDFRINVLPDPLKNAIQTVYTLSWATMLIRAYKRFGSNPEGATVPIAWTEATFGGGVGAVPAIPGNRPKCNCGCKSTGNIVNWDYVWEPNKPRGSATPPK